MKPALAILLIASLVLASPLLQTAKALQPVPQPAPRPSPDLTGFCDSKCSERCAKAGYKKRCMDYCGICCKKCKCVPSGTYGNKSECPCYRDMLNTKGTSKCP